MNWRTVLVAIAVSGTLAPSIRVSKYCRRWCGGRCIFVEHFWRRRSGSVAIVMVGDWGWDDEATLVGGGSEHLFTSLYAFIKDAGVAPSDKADITSSP